MKIPLGLFDNLKRKRNGIMMIFLMLMVFGMGVVEGGSAGGEENPPGNDSNKSNPKPSKKSSSKNKNKEAINGTIDFHTKMLLVTVSIFMLIFVIALLVIGHFTWFADIRKKLEEEWDEELKAEEEKRIAKNILNEMVNPFEDEELGGESVQERRISVDSVGCARGQCVPPHHSILCPNNPNIPSLNEPFSFNSLAPSKSDHYPCFDSDPIEYRNRPSTEWMNLDSSVKISEPLPLRDRSESRFYLSGINSFSTGVLGMGRKPPMAPATPDPDANDFELGSVLASPQPKFDISKLDML